MWLKCPLLFLYYLKIVFSNPLVTEHQPTEMHTRPTTVMMRIVTSGPAHIDSDQVARELFDVDVDDDNDRMQLLGYERYLLCNQSSTHSNITNGFGCGRCKNTGDKCILWLLLGELTNF